MLQCMVVTEKNMAASRISKLNSNQRKDLILDLCRALSTLKTPEEVADALLDLLTPKEIETIAKRLEIADLLLEGIEYQNIRDLLKVGYSTIARVNTWLNLSGKGYKLMLSRKKNVMMNVSDEEKYDPFSWHNVKRRYSLYFWPQLLIEELMKHSDKKQTKKIQDIFERLNIKKRQFSNKKNKELFDLYSGHFKRSGM